MLTTLISPYYEKHKKTFKFCLKKIKMVKSSQVIHFKVIFFADIWFMILLIGCKCVFYFRFIILKHHGDVCRTQWGSMHRSAKFQTPPKAVDLL